VFEAIEKIRSLTDTIDIVFANAGICWAPTPLSPDGLETVFATNHVGHYALITRLLPTLMRTASTDNADARVVITSSSAAWYAKRIDFSSLHTPFAKEKDELMDMYTRSKLANLLFGLKLAAHVRDRGCSKIYVNVGDPGVIFGTGIHLQVEFAYTIWVRLLVAFLDWWLGLSVQDGALTSLFLGTSPVIRDEKINGQFYRPFGDMIPRAKYPKYADKELAEMLWEWSENFVSAKEANLRPSSLEITY
jgi:NAD(P)-dependent dehydrogenase (short-subunit alcohol dehydrogenase family)